MFEKNKGPEEALEEIKALREKCASLVMVSISGLSGEGYEGETLEYINQLNSLNQMLEDMSDTVIDMENRVPKLKKGETDHAAESLFDSPVNI